MAILRVSILVPTQSGYGDGDDDDDDDDGNDDDGDGLLPSAYWFGFGLPSAYW
eukprot:CAMPEP_0119498102 /NCGR_PEP_ID=MMETSP1344-20130328/20941_1 /TAXON_ID=236787 /ORGANISM="Florenciella parvula, Strain CCMP2471" /LENGTH=52 /DNA_ID=CAMNT_0007533945 /DNA_START=193 /DNA_END=348 /DNA_ORIENTATION=-